MSAHHQPFTITNTSETLIIMEEGDIQAKSPSFLGAISVSTRETATDRLDSFLVTHAPHRPLALVSSGGTAVDLEQNTVRTLENFSTGWRGAVAVEGLLRKGYAVIHLQRLGSTSPFARVLVEECGGGTAAHQGLTVESMDRLVARAQDDGDYEKISSSDQVRVDPWLAEPESETSQDDIVFLENSTPELYLRRTLSHSSRLQKAIRERNAAHGRLLTLPFWTVQEYLGLLELCAKSLQSTAGSQALLLLAAAVSDFYLPKPTEHKIQSRASDSLILELEAVPKVLGTLRQMWAPDVFVASFKLETDTTILKQKAEQAMRKYNVHMVIGNILQTRYEQVHVLLSQGEWLVLEKPSVGGEGSKEALEELLLQAVVEGHFAYMSGKPPTVSTSLRLKQRHLQRQKWVERGRQFLMEAAGVVVSLLLSYGINRLVFRPSHHRH